MKNYEAYIFDLYGTLIDIHTDEYSLSFWKKVRDLFSMYGADYQAADLRDAYFAEIKRQETQKQQTGHLIEIEIGEVFRTLLQEKGVFPDREQIEDIALQFRRDSTTHLRLYAGTEELLMSLHRHGGQVYLLSNAQTLFTMPELRQCGLDQLFDDIVISSATGYRKPDKIFFQFLLHKHHLTPENCLMIGNDLYADIAGAQATGMDSYYVHSALSPKCATSSIVPTYRQDKMDLNHLQRNLIRFT